jgi:molybdopterin-guanine dinucleotide biosynthesis protein A
MNVCIGEPWGVILAGGKSERMGADKALLELGGRSLIERSADAMARVFGDRLLIAADREDRFRGKVVPRVVADRVAGAGPMAGLLTALEEVAGAPVFAVACDMPNLDSALIERQIQAWRKCRPEAMVPVVGGRPQPLHAIYAPSCAVLARQLLNAGKRRMLDLVAVAQTVFWQLPPDMMGAFENVNTPSDWARTIEFWRRRRVESESGGG